MATKKRTCSIDGCSLVTHARGWCNKHYRRFKKTGDPLLAARYMDPAENIKANTERQGDCIVWTGSKNQKGYGRIKIDNVLYSVHRVAWELERGPIPDGMQIDHTCWSRACVRVEHLRLATPSENKRNAQSARVDSETGIRNIRKDANGFIVRVQKDHKRISRFFSSLDDAIAWEKETREELFGEFAGRG